jgi:hypothetical protein
VLNELGARELIRPLTTQGHISDLLPRRIVHDAQTSDGGSGGPIFGANGKVIGINQAVLDNSPAKFGVPIRYGTELLQKQTREFFARVQANEFSLDGEQHIKDVSLDFCKKQKLKEAMIKSVGLIQQSSYDENQQ